MNQLSQTQKKSSSVYSAPGLWALLDRIPRTNWPAFIRGDCDWGSDTIMTEAEQRGVDYLFKLRKSPYVKELILQQHCKPGWEKTHHGWEALATELKLSTWKQPRRVVLVRRRLQKTSSSRRIQTKPYRISYRYWNPLKTWRLLNTVSWLPR